MKRRRPCSEESSTQRVFASPSSSAVPPPRAMPTRLSAWALPIRSKAAYAAHWVMVVPKPKRAMSHDTIWAPDS